MGNNPHEQPSINIFYHLSTPLFKQFNYAQVNCTFAPGSGLILLHVSHPPQCIHFHRPIVFVVVSQD
jgi:hypothetical protein